MAEEKFTDKEISFKGIVKYIRPFKPFWLKYGNSFAGMLEASDMEPLGFVVGFLLLALCVLLLPLIFSPVFIIGIPINITLWVAVFGVFYWSMVAIQGNIDYDAMRMDLSNWKYEVEPDEEEETE